MAHTAHVKRNYNKTDTKEFKLPGTVVNLCAGAGASVFSKTCFAPFIRTKIVLQTQNATSFASAGMKPNHLPFMTAMDTLFRLPKEQGFLSLWRGNFTNCSRVAPTYALRLTFMSTYQKIARYGHESSGGAKGDVLPLWRQMVAGGLSGGTAMLFTYPLDLLRTRMQADVLREKLLAQRSMLAMGRETVRVEGWLGLYKGLSISLVEIMPYMGITLGGYEYLKSRIMPYVGDTEYETWGKLSVGWMSGVCGSLALYPVDTVKRLIMVDGSAVMGGKQRFQGKGLGKSVSCVSYVLRNHGVRTLYRGCLANALVSGPIAAITFVTNDAIRKMLSPISTSSKNVR